MITFCLLNKSLLCLHDKVPYLEVQIRDHTKGLSFSFLSKLFPVLSQYFKNVCKCFHYRFLCYDSKYNDDQNAIIKPIEFPLLKCSGHFTNLKGICQVEVSGNIDFVYYLHIFYLFMRTKVQTSVQATRYILSIILYASVIATVYVFNHLFNYVIATYVGYYT